MTGSVDRAQLAADIEAVLGETVDFCARKICEHQVTAVMKVLEPVLARLDDAETANPTDPRPA